MHAKADIRIMTPTQPVIILGIDPGTVAMGYAVVSCRGQQIEPVHMGALRMSWNQDVFERLNRIYQTIDEIIRQYQPAQFAIEAPFYGKNVQSMLKLGRAQGVAIACAMQHQLPVSEYSPKAVKQAITGNGNADKEQVWTMLQRLTGISEKPSGFDASDALGVALCHYYNALSPIGKVTGGKSKGWDNFIRNNPGRIKG